MFKLDLEKAEEPEIKLPTSIELLKKHESPRKTSTSALLTAKAFNCMDQHKQWKILKGWEYQTTWPASWETCMQVRKEQLELDMEQQSLLQHHSSKASILRCSAFFTVRLSHPYMTTGKTIALTRWNFVDKVMSLLLNILSRLVITFLPRSKHLLISSMVADGCNHHLQWFWSPPK